MSYINFLKQIFTLTDSSNTPEGGIIRAGGKHITNTITLNANNTSASVNAFKITGSVKIVSIHGELITNTTLTNCTNVHFDLYDGINSVHITKTTGSTMSGYNVGAFFIKDADVSSSLTILNNNQCRIKESATGTKINTEFIAIQKTGTNTYIRFNYNTTDAPANATLNIDIVWQDIGMGTITAI